MRNDGDILILFHPYPEKSPKLHSNVQLWALSSECLHQVRIAVKQSFPSDWNTDSP